MEAAGDSAAEGEEGDSAEAAVAGATPTPTADTEEATELRTAGMAVAAGEATGEAVMTGARGGR